MQKIFLNKGKKQRALLVMNKKGKNFQPKKFKTKGCPNCILGVVQQSGTDWSKLYTASEAEEEWEGACLEKILEEKSYHNIPNKQDVNNIHPCNTLV